MVLFLFPRLIAENSASRAGRSVGQPQDVCLSEVCRLSPQPRWSPVPGFRSEMRRLPCPAATGHLSTGGAWGKFTLFPSGSQKRHESSQRFSRCCIHLQRPWKAPHAPAPGPLLSVTLGAPRLRDWHLTVTPLLALESSSASGLKKLHFRLQQEQERHTKYKCRGRET